MNDTGAAVGDSTPGLLADTAGTITTVHLALIVIFAVLVVIGIAYGMRLKRRRAAAENKVEAHADAAGLTEATPPPPAAHAPTPPRVAPPVAPAPPPLEPPPLEPPPLVPLPDTASRLADEPIAAAAPLEANPLVEADSAPDAGADPVAADDPANAAPTLLKGLGPKVAARLAELGITTVGQIATLDEDAAERIDGQLGAFAGRMARDRWIEQARFLAAGDRAGFEAVFGKL